MHLVAKLSCVGSTYFIYFFVTKLNSSIPICHICQILPQVTGFTDEVSDDCLRYYFENTKRSSGGEIEAFSRSEGHAFITFKDKTGIP